MLKLRMMADRDASTIPWTNVYGLARTALTISALITLSFRDSTQLFAPAGPPAAGPEHSGIHALNFFLVFARGSDIPGELARIAAIIGLMVVASGWRPRLTGVLHWWIVASFAALSPASDGGAEVIAMLTFLLIPMTLTDPRSWHWQTLVATAAKPPAGRPLAALVASTTYMVIRLQVVVIGIQAWIPKLAVGEWVYRTIFCDWLTEPVVGARRWLAAMLMPIMTGAPGLTLLSWSVLLAEVSLFVAMSAALAVLLGALQRPRSLPRRMHDHSHAADPDLSAQPPSTSAIAGSSPLSIVGARLA